MMNNIFLRLLVLVLLVTAAGGCSTKKTGNAAMAGLLADIQKKEATPANTFATAARLKYYDSLVKFASMPQGELFNLENARANTLLEMGNEQQSVAAYDSLLNAIPAFAFQYKRIVMKDYAMALMRLGERTNCMRNHSAASCIFPISGSGVHVDKTGSTQAIEIYKALLMLDSTDLESRWLMNIAYMTTGGYPAAVPATFLIPGLDADSAAGIVKPFTDVAMNVGFMSSNMAGGTIVDDFNNDGYLDIITSNWQLGEGMHYSINNGDGSFTDVSDASGLKSITGGLNIMQTDYNNDGLKDIFVLRGAWKGEYGNEPNSLLRNNGDGTFTDVTKESGLLSFNPKQTATWADFDNDGWVDVFIGNETNSHDKNFKQHPCELYMNNKNGTFTEVAVKANCALTKFVKGVTSSDYDNDGLTDIFLSTMDGDKILLKNEGVQNGYPHFKDVSQQAGLADNKTRTFPTWFWDYDNDGWPDILVCGYEFSKSLSWYAAAEALKMPVGNAGSVFLYHNKHDGSFEDVTEKVGLNKMVFAMGSNFGDIDNDGYPDIFLGTGNPQFSSLVPNKMFKNMGGEKFIDVTTAAQVGNLQKGHAVAFADINNDGQQDIYIQMGGAYVGDTYTNSLFVNPGQNSNHWIGIALEGMTCNRAAIGAKIKLTFRENNKERAVYSTVNSGGSFGSNPLAQHIGIGQATAIEGIEITWPGSKLVQAFHNVAIDESIKIKQGDAAITKVKVKTFGFTQHMPMAIGCVPPAKQL